MDLQWIEIIRIRVPTDRADQSAIWRTIKRERWRKASRKHEHSWPIGLLAASRIHVLWTEPHLTCIPLAKISDRTFICAKLKNMDQENLRVGYMHEDEHAKQKSQQNSVTERDSWNSSRCGEKSNIPQWQNSKLQNIYSENAMKICAVWRTMLTACQENIKIFVKVYTPSLKKTCHFIFYYNSRVSWLIFIIFVTYCYLVTEINTLQPLIVYLLNGLMTSYLRHLARHETLLHRITC